MTMCYYDSTDKESRTSTPSGLSVFFKVLSPKNSFDDFSRYLLLVFLIDTNGIGFNRSFLFLPEREVDQMAKYTEWLTDEGLTLIEGWARDGLIEEQIAKNTGASYSTFRGWKKRFPALSAALKKGKEVVDREVENALFKNAVGFMYEEETVTNAGEVVAVKKYSKPNITAQIFWLKNRKMKEWRDKQEVEQINHNIEITVGEWDDDQT